MNYGSFRYAFCAVLVTLLCSQWARAQACIADITGDRMVEGKDLAYVLSQWGLCDPPEECSANINGDGEVDGEDLAMVLASWGPCPVVVPSWATLIEAYPDPAVVHSDTLRTAITTTGLAWRVRDTATQIEMVLIPPGSNEMGCSASGVYSCSYWESPVHTVTLTSPFYMGRYEVTQAQWTAQMGYNPSVFQSPSAQVPAEQVLNRPVESLSWDAIQPFLSDTGMRLPTEAEWEYAYRAGTTTAFHSMPGYPSGTNDDNQLGTIAWFGGNSGGQTRPVGQKSGNGFGLHDMSGNVWEWVNDWIGQYSASGVANPSGPDSGPGRVLRGCSWHFVYSPSNCRASARANARPSYPGIDHGFRVTRNP